MSKKEIYNQLLELQKKIPYQAKKEFSLTFPFEFGIIQTFPGNSFAEKAFNWSNDNLEFQKCQCGNPLKFLSNEYRQYCSRYCYGKYNRTTTEDFVKKAKKIHNGFYSYEKTIYKTLEDKIIVTCPLHGDFEILAGSHLHLRYGCKECARKKSSEGAHLAGKVLLLSKEIFVKKSNELFDNFYDYSKVPDDLSQLHRARGPMLAVVSKEESGIVG